MNSAKILAVSSSTVFRAVARAFSMAAALTSLPCVMAESVARGMSRAAVDGSVMAGTLCGPRTRGRSVRVRHCLGPIVMGSAAQAAVALSWQVTSKTGGMRYFA